MRNNIVVELRVAPNILGDLLRYYRDHECQTVRSKSQLASNAVEQFHAFLVATGRIQPLSEEEALKELYRWNPASLVRRTTVKPTAEEARLFAIALDGSKPNPLWTEEERMASAARLRKMIEDDRGIPEEDAK